MWDNDVRVLEQPSRTALRADLAGSIITMNDAAEPNHVLVQIAEKYHKVTHQSLPMSSASRRHASRSRHWRSQEDGHQSKNILRRGLR